jgi:hypothetical protein
MDGTAVKRLLYYGFWRTGKAMGQVYQCLWRIHREIYVSFPGSNIMFYILYPFLTYLLTLPRILEFSTILAFQIHSTSTKHYNARLGYCTQIIRYKDSMNAIETFQQFQVGPF